PLGLPAAPRHAPGLDPAAPRVLASFGSHAADVTPEMLRPDDHRFQTLAPPREPPDGLRYEDLVAAADVVVSKPGYGIVSECIANDTALLYTSRGRFAEYDVFVREMPAFLRCRYVSPEDLLAGRWGAAIEELLSMPAPSARHRVDGANVAARHILDAIH